MRYAIPLLMFLAFACNGSGGGGPKKADGPPEGEALLKIQNTSESAFIRIDWREFSTVAEEDRAHWGLGPFEPIWEGRLMPGEIADCGLVAADFYDFVFVLNAAGEGLHRYDIRVEPDKNGVFLLLSHH